MLITKKQFLDLKNSNQLKIALIGMSNIGKSYRSNQLEKIGFSKICCDDKISERVDAVPYIGVTGLANWMNQPYTDGYKDRENEYLYYEEQETEKALQNAELNTVIDTTGSVIYISSRIKRKLKHKTLIVYMQAPESMHEKMFQKYMLNPKPVVWGNIFHMKPFEKPDEALKRCYSILLSYRIKKYEQLADVVLHYNKETNKFWNAQQFLNAILAQLNDSETIQNQFNKEKPDLLIKSF